MKRAKYWVLRDGKRKLWFMKMGYLGPIHTADKSQAQSFRTLKAAIQHEAYSHAMCCLEPEAVR